MGKYNSGWFQHKTFVKNIQLILLNYKDRRGEFALHHLLQKTNQIKKQNLS